MFGFEKQSNIEGNDNVPFEVASYNQPNINIRCFATNYQSIKYPTNIVDLFIVLIKRVIISEDSAHHRRSHSI